jgi:hypothetical protein
MLLLSALLGSAAAAAAAAVAAVAVAVAVAVAEVSSLAAMAASTGAVKSVSLLPPGVCAAVVTLMCV